jgi:hypothetical protein
MPDAGAVHHISFRPSALQRNRALFNYLVGTRLQRLRHG